MTSNGTSSFVYTGGEEEVPKDVTSVKFASNVTEVRNDAFRGCTKLREVELNEGLLIIGEGAFSGCSLLESIRL
eukprot:CAMPEP_0172301184 /NCGR_PEP_ID=MMETSP1058-20130122/3122_1 /TAXON_ID=83371 /ORGANISM="Detonula confervacea, Strain CCMP 353" /LENGTH=73 /DNA_ID=CAMNT_0013011209 /DNA_START=235 /DNA_END=452 /DNA_ORIENTATION=-